MSEEYLNEIRIVLYILLVEFSFLLPSLLMFLWKGITKP